MDKEIVKVKIKNKFNKILDVEIILYEEDIDNSDYVKIELNYENKKIEKMGENYFETLSKIRVQLEKEEIQIICKGAERNVYPSAMQLSMGEGRKAYFLEMKKQTKLKDIVDIFDRGIIENCVSVSEQSKYFEVWSNSLK